MATSDAEQWEMLEALKKAQRATREAVELKTALDRKARVKMPVVVAFGRFNPPTVGHAALVNVVRQQATRQKCFPVLFPSPSQDDASNPLTFAERVKWLRLFFPDVVINENPTVRTPLDMLAALRRLKVDGVTLVVGSDQKQNFGRLVAYVQGSPETRFKQFTIVVVPRNAKSRGAAGMSATKLREAAVAGRFEAFRQGVPTRSKTVAQKLYRDLRRRL